ncbi:MAG: hypothetical protein EWV83_16850 [Microcystis sp. M_OC_Ca_00000000_S217Cul]|uniref:hypothetical protein n=1 Tax=Microcystis TaxID=1125 RepID=UPI0011935480|nr:MULTISPECIES: hypothetical protein [Microcystis]TRT73816.1 MAG: hypothetical protein EWV83_16850 [Microcystis sp. M_OC_Ca_00000000_S217Cul]TRT83651.1 MAG: hypothetical protein EWV66_22335 [Microcystis sp. M_OC_Ca_00000000_C217Col]UZO74700.1 hypothetical protein M8120_17690 [Microcystis aeruginosa str. Chao 1910]
MPHLLRFLSHNIHKLLHAYISYQLSVISYQLSVISYQLSVISYQLIELFTLLRYRQVLPTKGLSSLLIPHSDENCYIYFLIPTHN